MVLSYDTIYWVSYNKLVSYDAIYSECVQSRVLDGTIYFNLDKWYQQTPVMLSLVYFIPVF